MSKSSKVSGRFSRRSILKGAACVAGAATGTRGITGFPAVHAQEPKVLRYLGTAVNQSLDIARKVKEDTGITIEYIPLSTDDVTKRVITQPNSFDIVDEEYFSLRKVIPSGNLLGMDARRIKYADKITPIFTKGELPSGKKIGDQGTAPKKVFYLEAQNAKTFSSAPTQWITLIPTVYNADTLGIRPDLIKRPIESWKELLNPEFKGKTSLLNIPSIGIMDAAMVVEALGEHKYSDKGNMTKAELDLTMKVMTEAKKAGQFRAFWKDFNEIVNWFLDGWAGAYLNRQGYYSAVLETAKSKMEPYEWAYWMEAKPAEKDIKAPDGTLLEKAGVSRDGGSYEARMGGVACWNAVMDENDYLIKKWNEFIAA